MTPTDLPDLSAAREAVRARMAGLGVTHRHAERLAGLPTGTLARFLRDPDPTGVAADSLLALFAALGLRATVAPVRGFCPPPPPTGGRPPGEGRDESRRAEARRLHGEGKNLRAIGDALGVSRERARQLLLPAE